MTNTELTLEQLQGIQGGIFLMLLAAACAEKKEEPKDEPTSTFLTAMGGASICKSESDYKHADPKLSNANCPDGNQTSQVKEGGCDTNPF